MNHFFIIIDGSNVANFRKTKNEKAKIENLDLIYRYLSKLKKEYPIDFEIITDATLRYQIDNIENLENAYRTGKFIQCPNKIKADEFILEFHKRYPDQTLIISNDNFTEYNVPNLSLYKFVILFNDYIIKPNIEEIFELNLTSTLEEGNGIAETS